MGGVLARCEQKQQCIRLGKTERHQMEKAKQTQCFADENLLKEAKEKKKQAAEVKVERSSAGRDDLLRLAGV